MTNHAVEMHDYNRIDTSKLLMRKGIIETVILFCRCKVVERSNHAIIILHTSVHTEGDSTLHSFVYNKTVKHTIFSKYNRKSANFSVAEYGASINSDILLRKITVFSYDNLGGASGNSGIIFVIFY